MSCGTCTNWNLLASGEMAKHGMAICDHGAKWTYYPAHHTCARYRAAPAEVVAGRAASLGERR